MLRPTSVHFNTEQQTSVLYFDDGTQGECFVRGGICFPIFIDEGAPDVYGWAVLGCEDVKTGILTVFESRKFHVIDNVMETDREGFQRIAYPGLASWFNMCWTRYFGRKFFYSQDFELARKYRLDISRSQMVQPKPEIIEIESYDEADRQHIVWSRVKNRKIRLEENSEMVGLLERMKHGEKVTHPAIYALQVLLCGLDRFPYRKREVA